MILSDADRAACQILFPARLGWTGRLALVPAGTSDQGSRTRLLNQAQKTLIVILGVFGLVLIALAIGVVLQLIWWLFAFSGRLSSGIGPLRGDHAIYAETFAVWMLLYLGLCFVISFPPFPQMGLVAILIPQIGGLGALSWPVLRGVRWGDVREDIGLKWGRQGWMSPLVGVGAYVSAMPVLGVAMLVTLLMMYLANQWNGQGEAVSPPVHPIVEPIFRGTWTIRLQLLLVAVFAAVPEEIMFRGVLYRHLRESRSRWSYLGQVIFAALISSFVFAAIHPQGLLGIPILMTLAIVFAIVREWRGSLVPCMVTHAMVNAGTSLLLFLIAD